MKHLTEEELILHYYQEDEERERVEAHLAACPACAAAWQRLAELLGQVEAPAPERGPEYGREVWRRLGIREAPRRSRVWPRWAWAGAMASLVVAAFLAGRFWPSSRPQPPEPVAEQVRERILLVAVCEHLERSEMVLLEVVNTQPGGRVNIAGEQQRAQELVLDNRLYRQAALRRGQPGLAAVLEELERILQEIAHSPSELSPAGLEEIRRRVEAQGIVFKVRIIDRSMRGGQE